MRILEAILAACVVCATAASAVADIFQWEYINPAEPSQGKQASTALCPGGAGVVPKEFAYLDGLDLTKAFLHGADLTWSSLTAVNLTNADLTGATLKNAYGNYATFDGADFTNATFTDGHFAASNFTNANLTDAIISNASFEREFPTGRGGLTLAQLYSTASYQAHQLNAIGLSYNSLAGGNFSNQNLESAGFFRATLTNANFQAAELRFASFANANLTGANFTDANIYHANFARNKLTGQGGITAAQLVSTASYQSNGLATIDFSANELSGVNFSGYELTSVNFTEAKLIGVNFGQAILYAASLALADVSGANFSGAEIREATFARSNFTSSQLVTTASYQQRDLLRTNLGAVNIAGVDFTNFNLEGVGLAGANVENANFTGAKIESVNFAGSTGLTLAQIYSTLSYQQGQLKQINFFAKDLMGAQLAAKNLSASSFSSATLAGANLEQANLSFTTLDRANFSGANLRFVNLGGAQASEANFANADLTGAYVQGGNFLRTETWQGGLTTAQIYTTASYANRELTSINLSGNQLPGVNFASQNMPFAVFELAKLDGADFRNANLVRTQFTNANIQGADFSGADTRGALGLDLTGILTRNTIYPGGELHGISLVANEVLEIRNHAPFAMVFPGPFPIRFPLPIDYELFGTGENVWYPLYYPFPILIDSPLNLTTNGTLRLTFDGNEWYSTFRFAEDIAPALAGNLDLQFDLLSSAMGQIGQTFQVFEWNEILPTGSFNITGPYVWDTSKVYSTGEVTLIAVPEPASIVLLAIAAGFLAFETIAWYEMQRLPRILSRAA